MNRNSKIYIAGHNGMVGSSLWRLLKLKGYDNLILKERKELDLLNINEVKDFFESEKPDYVFIAAAKVGGIYANNKYRADFLFENLTIQNNIISTAHDVQIKKLLFLGSSCIYPRNSKQPIKESYLLTGSLEPTNEPYAIAKIAGIKLCRSYFEQYGNNFISAMPTNLYGPKDNFDLKTSHVLPALINKFHHAKLNNEKTVTIWGDGRPVREFLHVDDLSNACYFLMKNIDAKELYNLHIDTINIGSGEEISIRDLALMIKKIIKYDGNLLFDKDKPNGMMKKVLDSSKILNLGWKPEKAFEEGIKEVCKWYESSLKNS